MSDSGRVTFRGYHRAIHAQFAKHDPEAAMLTEYQFELWWRMLSNEERWAELDALAQRADAEAEQRRHCSVCNCSNGHALSCPTLRHNAVLDLKAEEA